MAKRIRVKVTAQDIRLGKKKNCRQCPLALAIGRSLETFVSVYRDIAFVGNEHMIRLSRIAQRFIDEFDGGHKVKPHTFCLTLPDLERGANG